MKIKFSHIAVGFGTIVLIAAIAVFFGIVWLFTPTNTRDNASPVKQAEMVNLSLRWGRLSPFPKSAKDFIIQTEGSSFTRTFRGSFSDSPETISKWLQESPGILEGQSEIQSDRSTEYILKTGEGASYGEVILSPDKSHVSFQVSWS